MRKYFDYVLGISQSKISGSLAIEPELRSPLSPAQLGADPAALRGREPAPRLRGLADGAVDADRGAAAVRGAPAVRAVRGAERMTMGGSVCMCQQTSEGQISARRWMDRWMDYRITDSTSEN